MILDLVPSTDPILHQELPKFEFDGSVDPNQVAIDLTETMIQNKGLGLAANQVGLPHRVFVMNGDPVRAIFNPRLVDVAEETVVMTEGCLTYPGLFIKIKRPAWVRLRYTQANGETKTEDFTGLSARVVQHELDHLNGIVYTDIASRFHLEQGMRKKKRK